MNERALRDAELYEKTGRVRTPSPAQSTESEEKLEAVPNEEGDGIKQNGETECWNPHVVACIGEQEVDAAGTPETDQSHELSSDKTAEVDTNSDFEPSELEGDRATTTESTSSEKETTEKEDSSATSQDHGNPTSHVQTSKRNTHSVSKSSERSKEGISDKAKVSASLCS